MNWLDIVIGVCLLAGLIIGMWKGFVEQLFSFIALAAAIFFAGQVAVPMRTFLIQYVTGDGFSPQILSGLCYLLAFTLIILLIVLLGKVVSFAIKKTPAKPLNLLLGGLFGLFIWAVSVSIFLNILAAFDYNSLLISKTTREQSVLYYPVQSIVPTVYPLLSDYFRK
ncbi:MAG: CvpA family protein [Dysgonamonadaceae bacterium]|jgi:membrane protein required for colicin V production|nr:CvpA family protein [Dysgonamonadaceae bacterium]